MDISILVPLLNEEDNVLLMHERLKASLNELPETEEYEVIYIDDGSTDSTPVLLERIHSTDPNVVVLTLRRNFGQTAALAAGFDFATGDVIITIDGDLQYDPGDIPALIEQSRSYDIVCGWRKKRKDPLFTRLLPSIVINLLINIITGVRLHDHGCSLRAYKRDVIKNLKLYGEMQRFIPAMASRLGVKVTEIQVKHKSRLNGKSHYGLSNTLQVALDLLTVKFFQSFATKPIEFFGPIGFFNGAVGTIILIYAILARVLLFHHETHLLLLILGAFLVLVGVQFVGMGLISEILVRNFHESERKPIYNIKRIIGPEK
ncbi:MAG: glycosyltransferase family 2 protein [Nitrospirae bacterium]|nr:glycosyltransferase family 2 protein [Nitrospirota bacterium]